MQVTTDLSGLYSIGTPYVAPPKRPESQPLTQGDRSQEDRRQQQQPRQDAKSIFRSLLSDDTLVGLTEAKSTASYASENATDADAIYVRPERRPESGAVSVNAAESAKLYQYVAGYQARSTEDDTETPRAQTRTSPEEDSLSRVEYNHGIARYAEQATAFANVFAVRGETLELQA